MIILQQIYDTPDDGDVSNTLITTLAIVSVLPSSWLDFLQGGNVLSGGSSIESEGNFVLRMIVENLSKY